MPSTPGSATNAVLAPQLALAASSCILTESLHELLARYRVVTKHALGDADPDDEF